MKRLDQGEKSAKIFSFLFFENDWTQISRLEIFENLQNCGMVILSTLSGKSWESRSKIFQHFSFPLHELDRFQENSSIFEKFIL